MNILIVCSGNTCRSPMAAGLLRAMLKSKGIPAEVSSAGLYPQLGEAIAENAVTVMAEIDIDIRADYPKKLTRSLTESADKIVPLIPDYAEEIRRRFPRTKSKILPIARRVKDPFRCPVDVYRATRDALRAELSMLLPSLVADSGRAVGN